MEKYSTDDLIIFDSVFEEDYLRDLSFEEPPKKLLKEIISLIGKEKTKGSYFQEFLCRKIANSKNSFSVFSEKGIVPVPVFDITEKEIEIIKEIFNSFSPKKTKGLLYKKTNSKPTTSITSLESIRLALIEPDNKKSLDALSEYYKKYGYGIIGEFSAFYLEEDNLFGINDYEEVSFENLIGYDIQKNKIIENIRLLLDGKKTENMLLYGDAGTGKSSSIKATLTKFSREGLKLISLTKEQIVFLPKLFRKLSKRGLKFIIFIDDLSFEKTEESYKILKSILEGRIEKKPDNIIFAITTNRKNLVKETWKDRESDDDMQIADTIAENHSLKDRFSLYLSFMKPNKKEYLNIVFELAKKEKLLKKTVLIDNEKIVLTKDYIERASLLFERRHGGMTGRAAKTFVDYLISRIV